MAARADSPGGAECADRAEDRAERAERPDESADEGAESPDTPGDSAGGGAKSAVAECAERAESVDRPGGSVGGGAKSADRPAKPERPTGSSGTGLPMTALRAAGGLYAAGWAAGGAGAAGEERERVAVGSTQVVAEVPVFHQYVFPEPCCCCCC